MLFVEVVERVAGLVVMVGEEGVDLLAELLMLLWTLARPFVSVYPTSGPMR